MKRYKIDGIHCGSCAKIILMDLEEGNFTNIEIDVDSKELVVPDEMEDRLDEIKKIVENAGDYKLAI